VYRRKVRTRNKKKIKKDILNKNTILDNQVKLVGHYLDSIWEGKKGINFKYPNIEQLKYELSFNDLFIERFYQESLKNLVNQGDIYINTEEGGIRRIYDNESPVLLNYVYNFLKLKWRELKSLRLIDIWEEGCLIESISKDKFFEIIKLLKRRLLILLFKDEDGRVIIEKPLISTFVNYPLISFITASLVIISSGLAFIIVVNMMKFYQLINQTNIVEKSF